MSGSRDRMLGGIRGSLRRTAPLEASIAEGLEGRLRARMRHVLPALEGDPVERFCEKVTAAAGTVARVASVAGVSKAVIEYLEAHELPLEIVTGAGSALGRVRWSNRLAVEPGRAARDEDRASVTSAFAGIAETGTVMLLSGPESPTTLNFMPEYHLVVLERARIVGHLEDAWDRLRDERAAMPRSVNLITGPSRTGDVELNLEFGAHGPRGLHVILLAR